MKEFALEQYVKLLMTCENVQAAVESGVNIPCAVYANVVRKKNNAIMILAGRA